MLKSRTFKLKKAWVSIGFGKRLAFGFSLDKYAFNYSLNTAWVLIHLFNTYTDKFQDISIFMA